MTATYPIREVEGVKVLDMPKRITGTEGGDEIEATLEELLAAGEKNVILNFSRSPMSIPSSWDPSSVSISATCSAALGSKSPIRPERSRTSWW